MKNFLLLILTVFSLSNIIAQVEDNKFYTDYLDYYRRDEVGLKSLGVSETRTLTPDEIKKTKGSPYLNDQFTLGSLFLKDSLIVNNLPLRYNVYTDQIEAKKTLSKEEDAMFAIKKNDPDLLISIRDNVYQYMPAYREGNVNGAYFQVIFINKIYDLYKKHTVKYIPAYTARTSFDNDRPAEFSMTDVYYLVSKKGEFISLPQGDSRIIKTLAADKKLLKGYLKENNLNLSKEKDLARFIAYYNSLL